MLKNEYNKFLGYTKYHLRGISGIDAEDVLHEVAFNVFSKIDFDYAIENISSYLYRSIKNKIIDIMKKNKKTVPYSSLDSNNYSDTLKNDSIQEELDRKEINEQLHLALQKLPRIYSEIIIAMEFNGKKIGELSDEWEIPLGTLLARRHRALAKLQKMLEEYHK